MGLRYEMYEIATIRRQSFSGEKGLGRYVRLVFGVEIGLIATPKENNVGAPILDAEPVALHSVNASVTVKTPQHSGIHVGRAYTKAPVHAVTCAYNRQNHLALFVDLAPEQVEALEEIRGGQGGLEFTLAINAVTERRGNRTEADDALTFAVNQSDWLKVLEQIGYGRFFLFEIPFPAAASEDTDYGTQLRKAHEHARLGQYDEAVSDCRAALACYSKAKDISSTITQSEHAFCGKKNETQTNAEAPRNAMLKEARFLFLYRAAKHLTDTPSHPEGKPPQPFTRSQAISVLAVVAALLSVGPLDLPCRAGP